MASRIPSRRSLLLAAAAVGIDAGLERTLRVHAQSLSGDDPSKAISILVSHAAGGGYDAYARLYSRHLSRFLPGQPSVTVRNMPGAAGVVMANYLATQASRNGSVIALGPGSLATAALFGSQGARYDAREFSWIGSLNNDVSVAVSRADSPVHRLSDLFNTELVVGGAGASDNSVIDATILTRLFGAKLKLVTGYNGSGDTVLALERGEVQGIAGWNYSSITTMRPDWLKSGFIKVLLQLSLSKHPELPDVPVVLELARSDTEREVLKLLFAQSAMGRVLLAPPGVPKEQIDVQRSAFERMLEDSEFKEDVKRSRLEAIGPMNAIEVDALIAELHASSAERIKEAASLLGA